MYFGYQQVLFTSGLLCVVHLRYWIINTVGLRMIGFSMGGNTWVVGITAHTIESVFWEMCGTAFTKLRIVSKLTATRKNIVNWQKIHS